MCYRISAIAWRNSPPTSHAATSLQIWLWSSKIPTFCCPIWLVIEQPAYPGRGVGRREEALAAITEAIEIREHLAELRPAVCQEYLDKSREVRDWFNW
jgi:hypothetical protein